jgi:hypothetical protein
LLGDEAITAPLRPADRFLCVFVLAAFMSPSAFFFVTRACRIGIYSSGTPGKGSAMNALRAPLTGPCRRNAFHFVAG